MSSTESVIQIEQRMPRCGRCGKMINLRGSYIEALAQDRERVLFCSGLCHDEYADLIGVAATEDAGNTEHTRPGRAR